jgi:hypothetical protein
MRYRGALLLSVALSAGCSLAANTMARESTVRDPATHLSTDAPDHDYIIFDDHEIALLSGSDSSASDSWQATMVRSCLLVRCTPGGAACRVSLLVFGDNGDACRASGDLVDVPDGAATLYLETGEDLSCPIEIDRGGGAWTLGGVSAECHDLFCGSHASLGPGRSFSARNVLPVTESSLRSCGMM